MTSILENYEQWAKEKQEERDAALPIAIAQLQAIGRAIQSDLPETVESIEVEYYGGGDDGSPPSLFPRPKGRVAPGYKAALDVAGLRPSQGGCAVEQPGKAWPPGERQRRARQQRDKPAVLLACSWHAPGVRLPCS